MVVRANSTDEGLRQMFRGWDSVESYRDPVSDEFRVMLTVSARRVASFFDKDELIDQLWPKKVRLVKMGVRYHGRIVGKR